MLETAVAFYDDYRNSNSFLNNKEANSGFSKNKKLDLIIYDTCPSATIEETYQIRIFAKAFIGSPALTPGIGFPYKEFIENIKSNSSIVEIGENLVSNFAQKYYTDFDSSTLSSRTITFYSFDSGYLSDIVKKLGRRKQ